MKNSAKLELWQRRLTQSDTAYSAEVAKMDDRERLYNGDRTLTPLVEGDHKCDGMPKKTSHVRNVIFENIESQISSSVPQPKVTPRRQKDERLAEIIEIFLRAELDRMPFEMMNDMAERTVPIQGGVGFLVEWDNTRRTHTTVGEVSVTLIHPKQFAPQPGVYTGIEDMDWFIIKMPTTKEAVKRKYGVNVSDEAESEPDVRAVDEAEEAEDTITQYIGFEKNGDGGINRYSWVNDVELEDLTDYQARRQQSVCVTCGHSNITDAKTCEVCGGDKFETRTLERDPMTNTPYFKPDVYPIILQRSVSVYGQLLGNSDVDQIRDQQNTINRIEQKIIDRMMKAGTRITLPDRADFRTDPEDGERWHVTQADKNLIDVYDFTGNLQFELAYLAQVYEEARQIIGITDSYQGRKDNTASSGKAKEFSAAQAAGRLESKRVMKDAAYAGIFEMMFKFWLAYSDEPRPVAYKNSKGENEYLEFNRYDFLEQDESGEFYWNDRFLFSCDTSAPLANNREAMWQETRMNLQTGAFGDPASTETQLLFWAKMENLHYPDAGNTKKFIEERMEREQMQQQQQMMMEQQQQALQAQQAQQQQQPPQQEIPPEILQAVEQKAREDAMMAVRGGGQMQ